MTDKIKVGDLVLIHYNSHYFNTEECTNIARIIDVDGSIMCRLANGDELSFPSDELELITDIYLVRAFNDLEMAHDRLRNLLEGIDHYV